MQIIQNELKVFDASDLSWEIYHATGLYLGGWHRSPTVAPSGWVRSDTSTGTTVAVPDDLSDQLIALVEERLQGLGWRNAGDKPPSPEVVPKESFQSRWARAVTAEEKLALLYERSEGYA